MVQAINQNITGINFHAEFIFHVKTDRFKNCSNLQIQYPFVVIVTQLCHCKIDFIEIIIQFQLKLIKSIFN